MNWIHEAYASSYAVAMMRPLPDRAPRMAAAMSARRWRIKSEIQPSAPARREPRQYRPSGHYFHSDNGCA